MRVSVCLKPVFSLLRAKHRQTLMKMSAIDAVIGCTEAVTLTESKFSGSHSVSIQVSGRSSGRIVTTKFAIPLANDIRARTIIAMTRGSLYRLFFSKIQIVCI